MGRDGSGGSVCGGEIEEGEIGDGIDEGEDSATVGEGERGSSGMGKGVMGLEEA